MKQGSRIGRFKKILKKVKSHQERMRMLSDTELSHLTLEFKERLSQGESLDDLLPEAFAAVCEADYRILDQFPYDVQILGAIVLHQGYLAEMNTGEGKTLAATMPLYLNALTGKSTILVTMNNYLALRDAEEMGRVYRFLGLTIAAGVTPNPGERLTNRQKKEIYAADIVYTTHSSLGFDYLFHNLVTSAEDRFLREFYYVIIDEADSVLLDSAQIPLIVSGSPRVQSNRYEMADFFVTTLVEDVDYEKEEKKVWLTEAGIRRAEVFFGIDNFYAEEYFEVNRYVTLALRAHVLFQKEREYVISGKGEIVLLDSASGRMRPRARLQGGQHQALETKERLTLTQESRSVASITYQNLFLLFPKMAGMSGTIVDAAAELLEIYGEKVVVIPPNKPMRRLDYPDEFFPDFERQFEAAIDFALQMHAAGRPVLLVTSTIAETEFISRILIKEQVPHNVLNANNAAWEAEIIKEAGQLGAVTVATSMAGRGTDIRLAEGVAELGGLAVIGVGRMANIRLERQARGRAGRQGDPGCSKFFVSLEDEVVGAADYPRLEKYIEGNVRIGRRRLKRIINTARKVSEEFAFSSRKRAFEYDLVMKLQRKLMYATRDRLLDGGELDRADIIRMAKENIRQFLDSEENLTEKELNRYILDNLTYRLEGRPDIIQGKEYKRRLEYFLLDIVRDGLKKQAQILGSPDKMQEFMRRAALNAIDKAWVEQVDYLQQLQSAVAGRASAQLNPVFEYQKEGLESFRKMERDIRKDIVRNILLGSVSLDEEGKIRIVFP